MANSLLTVADWISNARIEDPSTAEHPELDGGVEVLIFAALPETLPPPDAVGDIIRFHRLQVRFCFRAPGSRLQRACNAAHVEKGMQHLLMQAI